MSRIESFRTELQGITNSLQDTQFKWTRLNHWRNIKVDSISFFVKLLEGQEFERVDTVLKGLQNLQPFVFLNQNQTGRQMLVFIFK